MSCPVPTTCPPGALQTSSRCGNPDALTAGSPGRALSPAEHLRLLHPKGRGWITLTQKQGRQLWKQQATTIKEAISCADALAGRSDIYVSQQRFRAPCRQVRHLAQLGALYVDVDFYKTARWSGVPAEQVATAILLDLGDEMLPAPSYILFSGGGLVVTWLHHLVRAEALPRWSAVERELIRRLKPFGADPCASDAARVFRLCGTRHSGTGETVRLLHLGPGCLDGARWSFDDLAHEILPATRERCAAMARRRAERADPAKHARPVTACTSQTYWQAVRDDLMRLLEHRWHGTLPAGQRDAWLFCAAVALSWLQPPECARSELNRLAWSTARWSEAECRSRMSAVFRRAAGARHGEQRYRISAEHMVDRLEITEGEMLGAGLRVLLSATLQRRRAAERQAAYRRRRGAVSRSTGRQHAAEQAREAEELRRAGLGWAEIAVRLCLPSADAARHRAKRHATTGKADSDVTVNGGVAKGGELYSPPVPARPR